MNPTMVAFNVSDLDGVKLPLLSGQTTSKQWVSDVKQVLSSVGSFPDLALSYRPSAEEYEFLDTCDWVQDVKGKAQHVMIEMVLNQGDIPDVGEPVPSPQLDESVSEMSKFVLQMIPRLTSANWFIIMNGVVSYAQLEENLILYCKILSANKNCLPAVANCIKKFHFPPGAMSLAELFETVVSLQKEDDIDQLTKNLKKLVLASSQDDSIMTTNKKVLYNQVMEARRSITWYLDNDPQVIKQVLVKCVVDTIWRHGDVQGVENLGMSSAINSGAGEGGNRVKFGKMINLMKFDNNFNGDARSPQRGNKVRNRRKKKETAADSTSIHTDAQGMASTYKNLTKAINDNVAMSESPSSSPPVDMMDKSSRKFQKPKRRNQRKQHGSGSGLGSASSNDISNEARSLSTSSLSPGERSPARLNAA